MAINETLAIGQELTFKVRGMGTTYEFNYGTKSRMNFLPIGFLLGGFLLAASISERSLRTVSESLQGRLLQGTATLRRIHLVGIPLLLLLGYFFSNAFWPGLTAYFLLATYMVAARMRTLDLPIKLKQWQIASVASIAAGAGFAWISTLFL